MDEETLTAIRKQAERAREVMHEYPAMSGWVGCYYKDVPALLAEVERLRAQSDREADQALRLMGEVNELRAIAGAVRRLAFYAEGYAERAEQAGFDLDTKAAREVVTEARALLAQSDESLAARHGMP